MGTLRAAATLSGFLGLTVPLMPVQAALLRLSPKRARQFPHWYHKQVCRLLGIRIKITGMVEPSRPVLIVANHTSWLDIPVLSAVAPVSFVAKKEVAGWPLVSTLARLQRTVFVDRQRKSAVGETAAEILERLEAGDAIVLFAEGTSSDGNRVLPFRTSLFAAAKPSTTMAAEGMRASLEPVVQTVSIAYTHLHGVPLSRADRHLVGWYGDMEMQSHAWQLLKSGPLDVAVIIGPPVPLSDFKDRKVLAERAETAVRAQLVRTLRARPPCDEPVVAASPRRPSSVSRAASGKWR
ncbi:MAG: lysophospholipid acyltransferase family protein [Hyphomicrobium sp.]|nr:lysophospholipid acyltransferase family protein [Hyphomicrobium sp.]